MSIKIFEIPNLMRQLFEAIEASAEKNGGFFKAADIKMIWDIGEDRKSRILNLSRWYKELDCNHIALDEQRKKIEKRMKLLDSHMRSYEIVLSAMLNVGEKISTPDTVIEMTEAKELKIL